MIADPHIEIQILEKRIKELEDRIEKLEKRIIARQKQSHPLASACGL